MKRRTQIPFAIAVAAILAGGLLQAIAQPNAVTDRYLTRVQTELSGSLDTKKATVGQQVTVTIRQDTKLADDTDLPKGTKLIGHITQIQAQDNEHVGAMVAINFDHAELKDGKVIPVRSVIQALAPVKPMSPPNLGAQPQYGQMGGDGGTVTTRGGLGPGLGGGGLGDGGTGVGRGGTGGMSGGGVLGGTQRTTGRNPNAGNPGDGSMPGSGATPSGMPDASVGGTIPNSDGNMNNPGLNNLPAGTVEGSRPVVAAGESISTAPRATALPGVLLSTTATADASGTLIAPGRNISLSTGTVITLGVIRR